MGAIFFTRATFWERNGTNRISHQLFEGGGGVNPISLAQGFHSLEAGVMGPLKMRNHVPVIVALLLLCQLPYEINKNI